MQCRQIGYGLIAQSEFMHAQEDLTCAEALARVGVAMRRR